MKMRPSRVLKRLREGKLARVTKLNLADTRVVEIAAMSGVDCLWLDMEHMPNTVADIENNIRAAKLYDCDTIVRVPRGSYSDLLYPLEMDATAIMVPHVMGVEDAREIVRRARFHPIGRRPLDDGTPAGAYCQTPLKEFLRDSNQQRFIAVQIEDPEPMEELEAIAEIEGIDMLFFGPGDFSQGLGVPGEMDHPDVLKARRRVAEVAKQFGKFAGTPATPDNLDELADMGYQFLNLGSDVTALGKHYREIVSSFQRYE